ncbi:MAG: polymer-forming cytoskeletal protein [Blastocatellia bacterium]|nr:polymer-forming cytoskeletal protein [Blastocatellia bacterium]
MGRGSKPEQSDELGYQAQTAATAYPPATEQGSGARVVSDSENIARDIKEGRLSGFVGHGTVLNGDTNFQMMLRVDGHLTGSVTSDGGTLIIGTNGQVDANVSVAVANINGAVKGDIVATEKIHLGRTAKVAGNITCPKLVIEDGALLEGSCSMISAREKEEAQSTAANSQPAYQSPSSSYSSSYGSTSSSTSSSSIADDDDDSVTADDDDDDEKSESATV